MKKWLLVLSLAFQMGVCAQAPMNMNQIKAALNDASTIKRLEGLNAVTIEVQTQIESNAPKGGVPAVLSVTRGYLAPIQLDIMRAAEDENPSIRAISAHLLGYANPSINGTSLLVKLARDESADVQYRALDGLLLLNTNTKETREVVLELMGERVNDNLFRSAAQIAVEWKLPEGIDALIKALSASDPAFKGYAAEFLSMYGKDASVALPELSSQLNLATDLNLRISLQAAIEKINASKDGLKPNRSSIKSLPEASLPVAYAPQEAPPIPVVSQIEKTQPSPDSVHQTVVVTKSEEKGISWWAIGCGFAFVIAAAMWLIRFTKKPRK